MFHTPGIEALIVTTQQGRARLASAGAEALASTQVRAVSAPHGRISPATILKILKQDFGVSLLLHEGGPTFFGEFVSCGLADELFLTIAPQIAGRSSEHRRPGVVSGIEFMPAAAPWLSLVSVKQAGDHLYLRYRR